MRKVNEIFTISREIQQGSIHDVQVVRMENGLDLLSVEIKKEKEEKSGMCTLKLFTFKCTKAGSAILQFATMDPNKTMHFEELQVIEVQGDPQPEPQPKPEPQPAPEPAPSLPIADRVCCVNNGGFVQKFCVVWKKGDQTGETGWTEKYPNPKSKTIDLNDAKIPDNAEVWIKVDAIWGKTKEAADHLLYKKDCKKTASYRTWGATLTYSIALEG